MAKTKKAPLALASSPLEHQKHHVFDVLYGFIQLTPLEAKIIASPYYQRLRWIKQLGFAHFTFTGAEHTRFAHALGVLHCADRMVRSLGLHVSDQDLFGDIPKTPEAKLHQEIRLAALLHDIGAFPFSHTIENSYIQLGDKSEERSDNHEHLGSYIIKNTPQDFGITHLIEEAGLDPQKISYYIKGVATNPIVNQILHSDIDADRMDYLVRDAHYTGLKYGIVDQNYLLFHLVLAQGNNAQPTLAFREAALHALEDFLLSRYSWYAQVVRNSACAKYDVLAADLARILLRNNHLYKFQDLLSMIRHNPFDFFGFQDAYFLTKLQSLFHSTRDPILKEKIEILLLRGPLHTIKIPEFSQKLVKSPSEARSQAIEKLNEIEELFKRKGDGREWLLMDLPQNGLSILSDHGIYITDRQGHLMTLSQSHSGLLSHYQGLKLYIPHVYTNKHGMNLLKKHGLT